MMAEALRVETNRDEIYTEGLLIALNEDDAGPTRSMFTAFGWDRDGFLQWQEQDPSWAYPRAVVDAVAERDFETTMATRPSRRDAAEVRSESQLKAGFESLEAEESESSAQTFQSYEQAAADFESTAVRGEGHFDLPYSSNSLRVLQLAAQTAEARDADEIRPRHLLAGILENDASVAYKWLDQMGIDIRYVKRILNIVPESVVITPATFVYAPGQAFSDAAAKQDALGFEASALALAEIIAKPETIPPVVIGVYGPWGSGKSTFLSLVQEHLKRWDQENYPPRGRERVQRKLRQLWSSVGLTTGVRSSPRVVCVEFNAWAYTDATKLWAGLVRQISMHLDRELAWWQKPFFWLGRNVYRLLGAIVVGLIPVALAFIATLVDAWWEWAEGQEPLARLLAWLGAFGSSTLIFAKQTPLTDVINSLLKKIDRSEAEGVMHSIQEELKTTVQRYFGLSEEGPAAPAPQGQVKKRMRQRTLKLVVFIDELDRCPLERIVDILEAIKLFLAEEIFIVLMAVDTRVVAEAIHMHYRDVRNPRLAREYMEKIIQIPVRVPEAHPTQLAPYVGGLMDIEESAQSDQTGTPAATPARKLIVPAQETTARVSRLVSSTEALKPLQLSDTQVERDAIANFAAAHLDSNPRRIKRLLNTYRFVKILAARRGENTDSEEWQARMINWLSFTMRWPEFMDLAAEKARSSSAEPVGDGFLKQVHDTLPEDRLAEDERPPAEALEFLPLSKDEVEVFADLADNFLVENPPTPVEDEPAPADLAHVQEDLERLHRDVARIRDVLGKLEAAE